MNTSFITMQEQISAAILELQGLLNFCTGLDKVQKQSVTTVGSILEPFLHKTYHLSSEKQTSIEQLEGYEKFINSYNLWNMLTPIQHTLEKLLSDVADTRSLSGNNAFLSALDMYDELLMRRVTEKEAISLSDELRDYFPKSSKSTKPH